MKTIKAIASRFDNWWFGSDSPAALCLLRILLGTCLFVSMALTLYVFTDFFTQDGFTPSKMVEGWLNYDTQRVWRGTPLEFRLPFAVPRLNLLAGEPTTGLTLFVYLATMAAAASFAVGWRTRISGVVMWLGLLSVQTRNPLIIHSGDTLLRLALLYLIFSPCGAVYSLDWLKHRQPVQAVRITSQRLIAYQVALVYLFTAWWKFFGTYWMDGTATWFPSQMHEFQRFWAPAFLDRMPFVALGTYGTLAVEVLLGTLVFWRPLRKWILISGLILHGYIEYRFNIPMFAFIITSCYVSYYEGHEVEAWITRMKAKWNQRRGRIEPPVEPATPA